MNISSRRFAIYALLGSALFAGVALASTAQAAAAWPEKTVRLIVPFPAGGAGDLMGRSLGQKLQALWGQSVVPENRGGAGGIIAVEAALQAPADGYTLLLGTVGTHAINQALYTKLPYDPVKQFIPVAITHAIPRVLVIHPSIPANSVGELIAYARTRPGTLSFSSAGSGSTSHLAGELFKSMGNIDITHVPYKGSAPALADLLSGRISMTFDSITVYAGHIKAGKVRALGVTSLQRVSALPDVPTIAESGLPGFDVSNWAGIFVPAGTPAAIVTRLNTDIRKAMADADLRKQLTGAGIEPLSSTPEEFAKILREDIVRWAKVVKSSGARAD